MYWARSMRPLTRPRHAGEHAHARHGHAVHGDGGQSGELRDCTATTRERPEREREGQRLTAGCAVQTNCLRRRNSTEGKKITTPARTRRGRRRRRPFRAHRHDSELLETQQTSGKMARTSTQKIDRCMRRILSYCPSAMAEQGSKQRWNWRRDGEGNGSARVPGARRRYKEAN